MLIGTSRRRRHSAPGPARTSRAATCCSSWSTAPRRGRWRSRCSARSSAPALWAVASHTHNHHYAARGRMAALISGAAALIVGAAPGLINFFEHLGTTAK